MATPKVDALEKLLRIFTPEQLAQYADICERAQERAIERKCEQWVTVKLNEKGYPRRFGTSDEVEPVKPGV